MSSSLCYRRHHLCHSGPGRTSRPLRRCARRLLTIHLVEQVEPANLGMLLAKMGMMEPTRGTGGPSYGLTVATLIDPND